MAFCTIERVWAKESSGLERLKQQFHRTFFLRSPDFPSARVTKKRHFLVIGPSTLIRVFRNVEYNKCLNTKIC